MLGVDIRQRDRWQVGELAEATGLTVRTLHYWDEIGLLTPSERSSTGHRGYTPVDVQRLYRITLLRRWGFSLAEIGKALDDPEWSLELAMRRHLVDVDRKLALARQLRGRLAGMVSVLESHTAPPSDQLLDALEEMTMLDTGVRTRISLLVYEDIAAAHDYLVRVFGLGAGRIERDEEGTVIHAEVDAGDGVIWLHRVAPEFRLVSPKTVGSATGTTAVMVEDVDSHFARAQREGAEIVYPPTDMPYGFREYSARDPEGHLWSFMKALG